MDILSYSIRRFHVDQFFSKQVQQIDANWLVLDIGGHKTIKRGQFDANDYLFTTLYLNLTIEKSPDIQADAAKIPFPNNTFDVIFCGELLEHIENPTNVLNEIHRILKPNGNVLITVPFLFRIHGDPDDFGRYTDRYWSATLSRIGFYGIAIEKQGYYFSVFIDLVKQWLNLFVPPPWRRWIGFPMLRIQKLVNWLENKPIIASHPFYSSFTTGFGIIAYKHES